METRKKSHFQGLVVVKRRKILTVKQKLEIIEALEHNRSAKEIADLFGISKLQIFRIAKQKKTLLAAWKNNRNPDQKKIRRRRYQDVEEALLDWFKNASRQRNLPSRELLMKQACLIAKKIGRVDFKPSRFWLQNWATVNKVNLLKLPIDDTVGYDNDNNELSNRHHSNQAALIHDNYQDQQGANVLNNQPVYPPQESANNTTLMQDLLLKYKADDIYNITTVALYYRALPQKISGFKYEANMTEKNPWEIISVVLATNMTGSDKSEVWVIGQNEGSRDCFKGINNIPVTYVSSEDTCMSPGIFTEWVHRFDDTLSNQNRKVALIVQLTAATSVNVSLANINLVILPQSKKIIQPLDHGITTMFKQCYRRQIVERILLSIKSGGDMFSKAISQAIAYDVDLLDSAHMINTAWNSVSQEKIQDAFAKVGLKNSSDELVCTKPNEGNTPPEGMTVEEFSNYVSIDDNIAPVELVGEDDMLNTNTSNESLAPVENNIEDDEFIDLEANSDGEQQPGEGRALRQLRDFDYSELASGEEIVDESDASDGLNDYYGKSSLMKRNQVQRKPGLQMNRSSEFQQGTSSSHSDYVSNASVENANNVGGFVEPRTPRISGNLTQRKEQKRTDLSQVPSPTEALIALTTVRRYLDHIGHQEYDSFLKVESAVISHCTRDLR